MKEQARKAMYAAMGAPFVFTRRLTEAGSKMTEGFRKEFEVWAKEGEKVAGKVKESDVVEEISSRVDIDQIQGQVEKLRDQLEKTLANWRESFRPETKPVAKPAAKKPAARKPAAKRPATTATKKPAAARKTTAGKTATTTTARKPAATKS